MRETNKEGELQELRSAFRGLEGDFKRWEWRLGAGVGLDSGAANLRFGYLKKVVKIY